MDKSGFNELMEHIRPKLYRFALSYTRRTDEAEDVVQEVSARLWEQRAELHALRSVEAYAMRAVHNRCLDYLRSPRSQATEFTEEHDAAHEQTPYASLEQADTAAFVQTLISRLPEQQQAVIRLREVEEYELDEIAEILDMNPGAVRTNLSRARQKLREELLKQ
ncbi:MAG: sigma-70 family RNA polymerase sigma factor [Prevotellaceae bacterium]|jgi:RNA polymerase sigma-70 factor (ECF subfamily)|nr:sigma-70 family RNA polymerase sigma factor [Prevotellaceae bacterium]